MYERRADIQNYEKDRNSISYLVFFIRFIYLFDKIKERQQGRETNLQADSLPSAEPYMELYLRIPRS